MTIEGISAPSFGRTIADRWEEELTPLVGLEPSDPAYQRAAYPYDTPSDQRSMAAHQSGCALTQLVAARALQVVTYPEAERPYRGHTDSVTLCAQMFLRAKAWTSNPAPGTGFAHGIERGFLVIVGAPKPADPAKEAEWRATWGGWEHVLFVVAVRDGEVEVIEGGQPGVRRQWHPVTIRGGHIWIGARRVAAFGDVNRLEIAA